MPNRIDQKFADLRAAGRKALIAYISAGDPNLDATRELALGVRESRVSISSNSASPSPIRWPTAWSINWPPRARSRRGPPFAACSIACARSAADSQLPIVLYTYMNPIYRYGFAEFHRDAEAAGVDGLLILDLPPDEDAQNAELSQQSGLKRIRLIAPTTPPARIAQLTAGASGFVYYVSREGVTGERAEVAASLPERVAAIRATTPLPIAVGFGISTPAHVRQVARSRTGSSSAAPS